jgi:WD40 repeat protein
VSQSRRDVWVCDSKTGVKLFERHIVIEGMIDIKPSPDTTHLALVVNDEEHIEWVELIEVQSGRLKARHAGNTPIAWSPSSTTLALQDGDGAILFWELSSERLLLTISRHKNFLSGLMEFSPDGNSLASPLSNYGGDISILNVPLRADIDTPQLVFLPVPTAYLSNDTCDPLFSPDLNSVNDTGDKQLAVAAFTISPDGRRLGVLCSLTDKLGMDTDPLKVIIYDADSGKEEITLQTRLTSATHIEFSSDAEFLAVFKKFVASTRLSGRQSEVWRITPGQVIHDSNRYQLLRFLTDSHHLIGASFSRAERISIVDLNNMKKRDQGLPLSELTLRVYPLAIASMPGAHRLAAYDLDRDLVHLWDTGQRVPLGQLDIPQHYKGSPITQLALSANGQILAATSYNCILIWSLSLDGASYLPTLLSHELFKHPTEHLLCFSHDNHTLAYAADHELRFWSCPDNNFMSLALSEANDYKWWNCSREWDSAQYLVLTLGPGWRSICRVRDMTGVPAQVENGNSFQKYQCATVDLVLGTVSQPGLLIFVPSHKTNISAVQHRINHLRATISWYWIQQDGQLVLLELPAV